MVPGHTMFAPDRLLKQDVTQQCHHCLILKRSFLIKVSLEKNIPQSTVDSKRKAVCCVVQLE